MSRDDGREAALTGLPAVTRERLDAYVALLRHWQRTINLVAPATLPEIWTRHIADSLQVAAAVPQARRWLDLGSGGGFPGLVTAILLADTSGAEVHLVESDKRKAAFLRTAARETGGPAFVHPQRIEAFVDATPGPFDAVGARALAPLSQLVALASGYIAAGAVGVFPKGERADAELTGLNLDNRFVIESIPSRTDRAGRLLIVRASQRSS